MPNLGLDRQILAQICQGNQQAIRALEAITQFVNEAAPEELDSLTALINGQRRDNTGDLRQQLSELAELQTRRVNLSAVLARLDALEAQVARIRNLSALSQRVENLEKIIGV